MKIMKYNGALIDKGQGKNKFIGRTSCGIEFIGNLGFVKNQIDELVKMQSKH